MSIRKYLPLFVFSIWLMTLSWLLWEDNLQLFLKPSFKGLVTAAFMFSLLLCVGLVAHLFQSKDTGTGKHSWLNGLILLLPVLFIFQAGQGTLGEYAMQKRSMAASAIQKNQILNSDENQLNSSIEKEANPDKDISITTLIRKFDQFDGKQVSIQGLFAKTVSGHEELSAVFRYLITCCAADAQPVGVFISSGVGKGFENNQWVRVKGQVEIRKMDEFDVIFMNADTLEPLNVPDKKSIYLYN